MRLSTRFTIINITLLKTFSLSGRMNIKLVTSLKLIQKWGLSCNSLARALEVKKHFLSSECRQFCLVAPEKNTDQVSTLVTWCFQKRYSWVLLANDQFTRDAGEELAETIFTLICDVEPWFVLWIVTVEEEAGLVGGAEQRLGDDWTAEPVDDRAGLQRSAADL